jgi:hypothetical protein
MWIIDINTLLSLKDLIEVINLLMDMLHNSVLLITLHNSFRIDFQGSNPKLIYIKIPDNTTIKGS